MRYEMHKEDVWVETEVDIDIELSDDEVSDVAHEFVEDFVNNNDIFYEGEVDAPSYASYKYDWFQNWIECNFVPMARVEKDYVLKDEELLSTVSELQFIPEREISACLFAEDVTDKASVEIFKYAVKLMAELSVPYMFDLNIKASDPYSYTMLKPTVEAFTKLLFEMGLPFKSEQDNI